MDTPDLHPLALQRVQELLSANDSRRHLSAYGWVEGMPLVFARPDDQVEEVMGFVSIHGRAVVLALTPAEIDDMELWHVTVPSPIFARVPPLLPGTTVGQLCARRSEDKLMAFRVGFWAHSAMIHEIPLRARIDRVDADAPLTSHGP